MPYFISEQDHGDWSSSSSTSFSKVNWTWSEKDLIDIVILAFCQLTSCHSRICVLWNAILLGWLTVNKVVILPSLVNSQLQFFNETGPRRALSHRLCTAIAPFWLSTEHNTKSSAMHFTVYCHYSHFERAPLHVSVNWGKHKKRKHVILKENSKNMLSVRVRWLFW